MLHCICKINKSLHQSGRRPAAWAATGASWLAWALACLLCNPVAAETRPLLSARLGRQPNVILIVADDLGYGDVGAYGQKILKTPNIDRLAAEGTTFRQFYAGSTVCAPSRCVLMTGLDTGHCNIRGNGMDNLAPSDRVIPEMMTEQGYRCGLFGKWGLGHDGSDGIPTRKGFQQFFGYLDQTHAHNFYPTFLMSNASRRPLRNVVPQESGTGAGVASERYDYAPRLILDEARAFIEANQAHPFFAFLSINLPHANNEAKERGMLDQGTGPFADRDWPEAEKGFAEMIRLLDEQVGEIVSSVDRLGLREDTLILFTSDNGPHHEGGHSDSFFHSSGALRGSKRDLTEGGIRVPLIARWPGHVTSQAMTDHVGGFQDLFPTLGELIDGQNVPTQPGHGISFLPTLLGNSADQKEHEYLYWSFYEGGMGQAVRLGDWKGIEQPLGSPLRLYDLGRDISEKLDVAPERVEIVAKLRSILRAAYVPSDSWKLSIKN